MDVLTLSELQYHAKHGYYQQERESGNHFEVDLVFHADLQAAGEHDDLERTIDYQQAEQIVRGVMEGPPVKLIETLATRIGEQLFGQFTQVQRLTVRVRKLRPPIDSPATFAQIEHTWNRSS